MVAHILLLLESGICRILVPLKDAIRVTWSEIQHLNFCGINPGQICHLEEVR